MKNNLEEFYQGISEEVNNSISADFNDWIKEDYFTSIMGEYLSEIGEVDDLIVCSFRDVGLQLNAYNLSDNGDNLNLFVTIFNDSNNVYNIQKVEVENIIKRGVNFYRKSINNLLDSFKKDIDIFDIAQKIYEAKDQIETVRIILVTNGLTKNMNIEDIKIGDIYIKFVIWDIDRLYKCVNSGKMREIIEIDLIKDFGQKVECITTQLEGNYKVYLSVINGTLLAKIYEVYGSRLLERNVRSFLQVKGQVNKGIRKTLQTEPQMFLAYNNGISVVAEQIEEIFENGKRIISKIYDMQIVNGGQTTASIYSAFSDVKSEIDLSKVYVQMKLTVIEPENNSDLIIPNISTYSNTQNKIQVADFSANDPFHIKLEELSRITWTPVNGVRKPVNWFYERARGQYTDVLMKLSTTKKKKDFQDEHPIFTKTDLAKYENSWDQYPHIVCEGAQKNFKKFVVRLAERGKFIPDQKYYEYLIAKAILYKKTELIVKDEKFEAYRSNIVAYTVSYLSFLTKQCINLDDVWKYQDISIELSDSIRIISRLIFEYFLKNSQGRNLGEWTKSIKCWEEVKKIEHALPENLVSQLIYIGQNKERTQNNGINSVTSEEKDLIDKVSQIHANTWFKLSKWAKETNNFQTWQRKIAFTVGTIVNKGNKPSYKQSLHAYEMFKDAETKGFN